MTRRKSIASGLRAASEALDFGGGFLAGAPRTVARVAGLGAKLAAMLAEDEVEAEHALTRIIDARPWKQAIEAEWVRVVATKPEKS